MNGSGVFLVTVQAPAQPAPVTTRETAPSEWPAEPTPKHGIASIAWLALLFALVLAVAAWHRRRRRGG